MIRTIFILLLIAGNLVAQNYIVFEGDSITYGYPKDTVPTTISYPDQCQITDTKVNVGVSSSKIVNHQTATRAIAGFSGYTSGAKVCVFMMGTNDIRNDGASAATVSGYIDNWITAIRAGVPGVTLVGLTITDYNGAGAVRDATNAHILNVADFDIAIDMDASEETGDWTSTNLYYYDGIHPNSRGYQAISNIVTSRLVAAGLATRVGTTMPVGIPDPADYFETFDPIAAVKPDTTTHCPGWHAGTIRNNTRALGDDRDAYYIDNSHPSATDSGNTYGNPNLPRMTIPSVLLAAGDYMEIHGGGASYSTTMNPRGTGTAADPIWYVGVDAPVLSANPDLGFSNVTRSSYLVFDGLSWTGASVTIRPRADNNMIDHIVFRNCTLTGEQAKLDATGLQIGASGDTPTRLVKDVVVVDCEISNYGSWADPGEEHGINIVYHVDRCWILDTNIHGVAEDGIQLSHGGEWTSSQIYIGRCNIHDNLTNALDFKGIGGPVVVSECTMSGHQDIWTRSTSGDLVVGRVYTWRDVSGSPDFSTVGAGAGPYTLNTTFTATATTPSSWGTATVTTHNSSGQGETIVIHYAGSSSGLDNYDNHPEDVSIINNWIEGGRFGIYTSQADQLRVIGNLFLNVTDQPTEYTNDPFAIAISGVKGDHWITNNTFYGCDGGISVGDSSTNYDGATTYYRSSRVTWSGAMYTCINDDGTGISGIAPSDAAYWRQIQMQVWGNIIAGQTDSALADIYFSAVDFGDLTSIDYNLTWRTGGEIYHYGSTTDRNLAWMQANTSQQAHGLSGNPTFTNAGTADFTLQAGSPAIDSSTTGSGVTAYADFLSTLGLVLDADLLGNSRPANAVWDMGAYEYGATGDTAPPSLTASTIPAGGNTLVLTFTESVDLNTGGTWALSLSSGSATATYSSGTGTNTLTYSLSSTIDSGITGTVAYTQPGDGIADGAGNLLATLSGYSLTNNSTQGGGGGAGTVTVDTLNTTNLSIP